MTFMLILTLNMSAAVQYIKNTDGNFVCPHCDKICTKQNTMYYHIKKNHLNDLPYQCNACTDMPKFLQKSTYLHHCATFHPECDDKESNPYAGQSVKCPSCEHSTHTKANILIHYARVHCKDYIPTYSKSANVCKGCDKPFSSSSAYFYHSLSCFQSSLPQDYMINISRIK